MLIPRLDSVARTGIASPPQGLLVYQTNGRAGLWYYESGWQLLRPGAADNLGNHTATRNLNLANKLLVGNGGTTGLAIAADGQLRASTTNTGSGSANWIATNAGNTAAP